MLRRVANSESVYWNGRGVGDQ